MGIGEEDGRLEVVAQLEIDVERAVFVVVRQSGSQTDILDVFDGTGIEIALARYSCETEEVLVLKVAAIAPTHDLESDEVLLSRLYEASQVELTSQFAVFAITYETTIDIKCDIRSHRAKMSDDLLSLP